MQGSNSVECLPGSDYCAIPGRYGTEGTWRASNTPGSRALSYTWTDSAGHLWLFGGNGYDSQFNLAYLNDLWEFDPGVNEWVWRGGASAAKSTINGTGCNTLFDPLNPCVVPGVYGTKGVAAPGNIPGSHAGGESWTDQNGNFWLLGGYGLDVNGHYGVLNDVWEYSPSTGLWTWVAGTNLVEQTGVYGTLGLPATGNGPGARSQGFTWVDKAGSLWLFGGAGLDAAGNNCYLNDLWRFDVSSAQWTWEGGVSTVTNIEAAYCGQPGVYGTQESPASTNDPGGRKGGSSWVDGSGHLWLFGGWGIADEFLNDVWEFDPSADKWTWWNGSSSGDNAGASGVEGQASSTYSPASRQSEISWTDASGDFWLFGGQVRFDDSCGCTFNDLWKYAPSTNAWAWEGGSILAGTYGTPMDAEGIYGTQGVPSAANVPGSRDGAVSWTDSNGNLWLFGGNGYDSTNQFGWLNDLWRFQLSPSVPSQSVPIVSVNLSAGTINVNQPVNVSVSVTGGSGAGIPSGSVEASGAGYTSSTEALNGGTAKWTIPAGALPQGQDTLIVDYMPDSASTAEYFGAYGMAAVTVTPPPGFTMDAPQLSLQAGATTGNTVAVTVTPVGGFAGAVSLSASITASPTGATSLPTFTFGSTSPVNITGSGAQMATLTITTSASQTSRIQGWCQKLHAECSRCLLRLRTRKSRVSKPPGSAPTSLSERGDTR